MNRITLLIALIGIATGSSLNAQLIFTEVCPANYNGEANPLTGAPADWMEIYNGTAFAVDLGDYYLTDRIDTMKWNFPSGSYLSPGQYTTVWADNTDTLVTTTYHCNFGLSAIGETLYLFKSDGVLYDSLSYPFTREDISYGSTNDGSMLFFKNPTPGEANDDASGFLYAGGVSISPEAAHYNTSFGATISSDAPGTIRYTQDGSEPTETDPIYTGPIQISKTTVLRARLWQEGFEAGDIATASYIVNENENATYPVISLASDPVNFFDDEIGIYVTGTNGRTGYCSDIPRNYNQDWERPISFEFFNTDGALQIHHDGGVKIQGGCSRGNAMKSLAIFARSRYGSDMMNYPFFEDKPSDEYKGLILRNSGNDFAYTHFRDAMIQDVVAPMMNVDYQAYRPVQVFLNGEYWGLHNLREKVNEHWVNSNYGIPDENIDFMKNYWEVFAGDRTGFDSMLYFLEHYSLEGQANFDILNSMVDLDSYTDYLITHMYIANRDWPGNNQKCWRDKTGDNKWRYILFDLDFSMGLYNYQPDLNMFNFVTNTDTLVTWPNPPWSTMIMRRLFENENYRNEFIQRYLTHLGTTFAEERVNGIIDGFQQAYEPLMPKEIEMYYPDWRKNIDKWYEEINGLKNWAVVRPGHVRTNMANFFGLGEEISLLVEGPDEHSSIMMNGTTLSAQGFNGIYLGGVTLDLECDVDPGYSFSHWEIGDIIHKDSLLVPAESSWKYMDGGNQPVGDWTSAGFNDAGWSSGNGELGYGDGGENTVLDYGGVDTLKAPTYYFRKHFTFTGIDQYSSFTLRLRRDDGALVYLNGKEVVRDNMPTGAITYGTFATIYQGGDEETNYYEFNIDPADFVEGQNILAVEIHQSSSNSSDLSFDLELVASKTAFESAIEHAEQDLSIVPESGMHIRAVTELTVPNLDVELYINEILASNQGVYTEETSGSNPDWIEIYNAGTEAVDLAGLYLTDRKSEPALWRIPSGNPEKTTVEAESWLLFFADEQTEKGPTHTNFRLNSDGEFIGLATQGGDRVFWLDSLTYSAQKMDTAMGRYPDGNESWVEMAPLSPADSNRIVHVIPEDTTDIVGQEDVFLAQLDIFPNPVKDRLNIRMMAVSEASVPVARAVIRDLSGRICMEYEVEGINGCYTGSMEVSRLPAGIYLLSVEAGKHRVSKKIIRSAY